MPPNNSLERTGDQRQKQEIIELWGIEEGCEDAYPGRSARSR